MIVEVRLFASLAEGRFKKKSMDFPDGTSLLDLFEQLKISENQVGILLVNGCGAVPEDKLRPSDVVAVFPLIAGG